MVYAGKRLIVTSVGRRVKKSVNEFLKGGRTDTKLLREWTTYQETNWSGASIGRSSSQGQILGTDLEKGSINDSLGENKRN